MIPKTALQAAVQGKIVTCESISWRGWSSPRLQQVLELSFATVHAATPVLHLLLPLYHAAGQLHFARLYFVQLLAAVNPDHQSLLISSDRPKAVNTEMIIRPEYRRHHSVDTDDELTATCRICQEACHAQGRRMSSSPKLTAILDPVSLGLGRFPGDPPSRPARQLQPFCWPRHPLSAAQSTSVHNTR
eukprot:1055107-Pleurochrysis_carterae.AAC.1